MHLKKLFCIEQSNYRLVITKTIKKYINIEIGSVVSQEKEQEKEDFNRAIASSDICLTERSIYFYL